MTETSLLSQGNLFLRQHKKFRKLSLGISKNKEREQIDGLKTWPNPPTNSIFFSAKNLKESFKNEDTIKNHAEEEAFYKLWNEYDTLMHQYANAYNEYVDGYLNIPATPSGCNVKTGPGVISQGKRCRQNDGARWEECSTYCSTKLTEDTCMVSSLVEGGEAKGPVCDWKPVQPEVPALDINPNGKIISYGGTNYFLNKFNYLRKFDSGIKCTGFDDVEEKNPNSFIEGEPITNNDECGKEGKIVKSGEKYAYIDPTGKGFEYNSESDYVYRKDAACGSQHAIPVESALFNAMVAKGVAAAEGSYVPKKMNKYMHCVNSVTPFNPESDAKNAALVELNSKLMQKAADINQKLKTINTPEASAASEQLDTSTEKLMEDRNQLMSLQGVLNNNKLVMNSHYYKFLGWSAASILVLFLAYKQFSKK